jgi:hypothetical protein
LGFVLAALRCSRTSVRSAAVLAKASPKRELGERASLSVWAWQRPSGAVLTQSKKLHATSIAAIKHDK